MAWHEHGPACIEHVPDFTLHLGPALYGCSPFLPVLLRFSLVQTRYSVQARHGSSSRGTVPAVPCHNTSRAMSQYRPCHVTKWTAVR